MKKFLFILIMTGISINVISQKINCKLIHEGLFKLNTEYSGTTIIKRIRNIQIEENLILGFKMSYYVTWINDCTYELRPKKLIKGNVKFAGNLDDVFHCTNYFFKDKIICF